MAGSEKPLRGARVLVTRPVHQAESLCRKIEAAGGEAIRFPTIAIADPFNYEDTVKAIARSNNADWAIFVSPNAVSYGLPLLREHNHAPRLRFAAVGAATAYALSKAGIHDVLVPSTRYDSEGLLDCLPVEEVKGKTILLFRGEGGRALLADTLTARGATVQPVVCYRRVRPVPDADSLAHIVDRETDAIVITSREGLDNLLVLVPEASQAALRNAVLLVTSPRQAEAARAKGFVGSLLQADNTDDSILNTLVAWRAG